MQGKKKLDLYHSSLPSHRIPLVKLRVLDCKNPNDHSKDNFASLCYILIVVQIIFPFKKPLFWVVYSFSNLLIVGFDFGGKGIFQKNDAFLLPSARRQQEAPELIVKWGKNLQWKMTYFCTTSGSSSYYGRLLIYNNPSVVIVKIMFLCPWRIPVKCIQFLHNPLRLCFFIL